MYTHQTRAKMCLSHCSRRNESGRVGTLFVPTRQWRGLNTLGTDMPCMACSVSLSALEYRKPTYPDVVLCYRDHCPLVGLNLNSRPYFCQQYGMLVTTQTLAPDPDDGRPESAGNGKDGMKIRVERDANAFITSGKFQYGPITGLAHPDVADMNRIPACRIQNAGRGPWDTLIQQ